MQVAASLDHWSGVTRLIRSHLFQVQGSAPNFTEPRGWSRQRKNTARLRHVPPEPTFTQRRTDTRLELLCYAVMQCSR